MLKKLWRKITRVFTPQKPVVKTPVPAKVEPKPFNPPVVAPAPIGHAKDTINDGSPKSPDWNWLYDNGVIDAEHYQFVMKTARFIHSNKLRFLKASSFFPGLRWQDIAVAAYREDTSLSLSACLHNGEFIVGKNRKTSLVPAGRGPFNKKATLAENWLDAAIDAIQLKWPVYSKIINDKTLTPQGRSLKLAEIFNGLGYRSRIGDRGVIEYSPYVTSMTNHHDETSKYVADGKYDKHAKEKQAGVLALLLAIDIIEGTV